MNKLCTFMEDQRCSNAPFSPKLRGALIKSLTLKKMFLYILQLSGLLRLSPFFTFTFLVFTFIGFCLYCNWQDCWDFLSAGLSMRGDNWSLLLSTTSSTDYFPQHCYNFPHPHWNCNQHQIIWLSFQSVHNKFVFSTIYLCSFGVPKEGGKSKKLSQFFHKIL